MILRRREFLALAAGAVAGASFPRLTAARVAAPTPASAKWFFKWQELVQGVFATTPADGQVVLGGNVMVIHGNDGAILVDTKFASIARTLRREVESFEKPIRYVINTHHHADHTGGNWAFGGEKFIKLIAHPNAAPRIAKQIDRYKNDGEGLIPQIAKLDSTEKDAVLKEADEASAALKQATADLFAPRLTVATTSLEIPGAKFDLHHTGPGHTDNDLSVFVTYGNVLHTGDLCFNGTHPFIDASAGATTRGWQKALAHLQSLCDENTVVVPGHGPMTDAAALKAQSDYFDTLRDHVAKARDNGTKREEVIKMKPSDIPGFDKLGFERLFENALGVVFDELAKEAGEKPPVQPG